MPCWQMERADWADQQMKEMLAKARILADTFSGTWAGGLDAAVVRGASDALGKLGNKLPGYLIDRGILEAVAAASSSSTRGTGERRLIWWSMSVRARPTTVCSSSPHPKVKMTGRRYGRYPIRPSSWRQAGDTIDKILSRHSRTGRIEPGDPEYDHVNSDLLLRIRTWKEVLFRDSTVTYNLPTDAVGSVERDSFLNDDRVGKFAAALNKHFRDSLEKADPSWIKGLPDGDLTVVLTGGGAKLPMVRALGQGVVEVHGAAQARKLAPYAPKWLTEQYPDLEEEFPQLASRLVVRPGAAAPRWAVFRTRHLDRTQDLGTRDNLQRDRDSQVISLGAGSHHAVRQDRLALADEG